MNSWRRIGPVVAEVDATTEVRHAIAYAAQEALRADAGLVLVAPYHRRPARGGSATGSDPHAPAAAAEAALREAATAVRKRCGDRLEVSTAAGEGSRLKVLQRAAREARVLVVAREPDDSAGLVSTQGNLALAGRIGCPLIAVPEGRGADPSDRVVVGIDGTPLSLEAVEFAFRAAADRRATLTVVHSQDLPYRRFAADPGTWRERAALTVSETLAGWRDEYPEVQVTRLLTTRPVVSALARESNHAGLIVIGAHAGPLPIGDPVARRIIAELSCPVAIAAHHVTPAEAARRRREIRAAS
ncbi:universal stress protein [Kribbella sp. NPDC020789]